MNDTTIDNETGEFLPVETHTVSPLVAAEINQQIATAKQYPRRPDSQITTEISGRAALNEEMAMECQYSLSRGGKAIAGPSIRFAEIVRASYGNIRVAARFVRIDQDDPTKAAVIVEAVAHDLQTNGAEVIPIRRSVMTSGKGDRRPTMYSADMINMTVNAATALARRNAILAVVPKSLWLPGYQRVIKVLQGDANTLEKRRNDVFEAFRRIKVEPAQVLAVLGARAIDDVTMDHMPILFGMMQAIKDGETIASVLGNAAGTEVHQKVSNPLKDEDQPSEQQIRGQATVNAPQTSEKQAETGQTGSTPAREDRISSGPQGPNAGPTEAAREVSKEVGPKTAAPEKAAQAASPEASDEQGDGAEDKPDLAYIEKMRDGFDKAKSALSVRDLWSSTRDDRRELLGAEQIEELEKEKTKALERFKGKV